jgi:CDP-diacylglycerol---glycerol-3-phosphate 3-phosphatidyltransferase
MLDLFNLPNVLSLLRVPLALCLFINSPVVRFSAIFLAMLTDVLDGFLARRYSGVTSIGTLLDPLTDKLFVFTALFVFFIEAKMSGWELAAFLCRDISLLIFTGVLFLAGGWSEYKIRAFYCGKITTTLQFICLLVLSLNYIVPPIFYLFMAGFGVLSLLELFLRLYTR